MKERKSAGGSGTSEPKGGTAPSADPPTPRVLNLTRVDSIESLEEITEWLGTFRERLRVARSHERRHIAGVVQELEAHYKRRRGELA